MKIPDEVCNFVSLFKPPSKTLDDFETSKNFN